MNKYNRSHNTENDRGWCSSFQQVDVIPFTFEHEMINNINNDNNHGNTYTYTYMYMYICKVKS